MAGSYANVVGSNPTGSIFFFSLLVDVDVIFICYVGAGRKVGGGWTDGWDGMGRKEVD